MFLPKPPKLFRTATVEEPDPMVGQTDEFVPEPDDTDRPRAWSPTVPPQQPPQMASEVADDTDDQSFVDEPTDTDDFIPESDTPAPSEQSVPESHAVVEEPRIRPVPASPVPRAPLESAAQPDSLAAGLSDIVKKAGISPELEAGIQQAAQSISSFAKRAADAVEKAENMMNDTARYARPKNIPAPASVEPEKPVVHEAPAEKTKTTSPIETLLGPNQKVIRAPSVSSIPFADLWYTPEKIAYIRDVTTKFALIPFETDDIIDFYKALEQGYTGSSSYALKFAGESYRVERILTLTGVQYNCRKMPRTTPDIYTLGLPEPIVNYLVSLSQEAGLILFAGPTGMGKTTTASALMRKYLERDGGFMYTIEDPPEMPLDGLYHAANGALGLCKQCPVENERWGDGVKSALRSRPRYILVGEIRTPETASQVLRAATSGHLVLSTIHASSVEDALNSMIKYASGAGLAESLVSDLLARGILAVVHQKLEGVEKLRPVLHTAFANPNPLVADQMRMTIRDGKINLGTLMEAQTSKLFQNKPLFRDI